jgi:hypothetical protein
MGRSGRTTRGHRETGPSRGLIGSDTVAVPEELPLTGRRARGSATRAKGRSRKGNMTPIFLLNDRFTMISRCAYWCLLFMGVHCGHGNYCSWHWRDWP